ncbi:DNA-binding transcriptional activator of the SARP family [Streptosporangium subroseum]|uniref:DNA-binding transcriptional activator of the SARP family n=1 Tax=Streptosporangium subroseum TaxID=106412 RepID=A0A239N403_9ACTN|nr:BTAD domain-containing putative transcriptional regulator [Streptosporangium subroseum]SNT49615.1 DNA-binding transcriptional activator of the SARP family [Streptosporangium subroseum]
MEFRLLGPVEVWSGDRQVSLGGAKPRTLLAALLLDEGRVVPAERLVAVLWGEDPPDTARAVLQTYVSSLRRSFDRAGLPSVIVSHRVGYLADIPAEALDRTVFDRLVTDGRKAAVEGRHQEATESLRAALALWRGPALGGVSDSFLLTEAGRLDELRLTVTEERISAELALGRHEQFVGELTTLVARHPMHEHLRRDLMLALNRAGRRGEALAVYRQGRQVLAEELGIEPGPDLRQTHEAILRSDPSLSPAASSEPDVPDPAPPPAPASPPPSVPVFAPLSAPGSEAGKPYQLPPVATDFTGRTEEIASLRESLAQPSAMPICVISGAGGTGKSALALRVAHEIAGLYPDGLLYVELRGTTEVAATPAEVLGRLLRELGTPPAAIPVTLEERANQYRTLLAGRRMLVVLDDVATERQARPLLPGSPGCAVLITSRSRLPSLSGAALTELGVLSVDAALALLSRIVGAERIAAEMDTARMVVRQCGLLPLAIRIAGARLASRRQWPVQLLVKRLADERRRLDELTVGDQEVRASIGLSYEQLTEPGRRMLRHLGLLGLPHFSAWVAAAATQASPDEAEQELEQLVDASLVEVEGVDATGQVSYRLHDLIRLFARERAEAQESHEERTAAVSRVLGGWLWLIERMTVAEPLSRIAMRSSYRLATPVDPQVARAVLAEPLAWFRTAQETLIVGVELASAMDLDEIAVELASALCHSVFVVENLFEAWHRTHDAALAVARRRGNAAGEATLLAELGQLSYEQDRYAEAREYFSQALSMFRAAKDTRGECATLVGLGNACREQGYLPEALHFLGRAEEMWRAQEDDAAIAHVMRLVGSIHLERGDFERAWTDLEEALTLYGRARSSRGRALTLRTMALYHLARAELDQAEKLAGQAVRIFRELDDQLLESYAVRTLAKARIRLRRCEEALEPLERALLTTRSLRDRYGEAITLRTLGELHLTEGRLDQAQSCLNEAMSLWEALDLPLFRARTLRDLALLHAERGDAATAETVRAEAIEVFRVYGSREYGELSSNPL